MSERKALSLHIGVNKLDPAGYQYMSKKQNKMVGWVGELKGCHNDAEAYSEIAKSLGFVPTMLLTEKATSADLMAEVKNAADILKAGDIFLVTYAGHGGQIPDISGDEIKKAKNKYVKDSLDETWCLHDRHFIDDEKHVMYLDFDPGVRILEISDSCQSGGMDRTASDGPDITDGSRGQPRGNIHGCYATRKDEYDKIQTDIMHLTEKELDASYLLIAACQENELAGDGFPNGRFTTSIMNVMSTWQQEKKEGSYSDIFDEIAADLALTYERDKEAHARDQTHRKPFSQTPKLVKGTADDPAFYEGAAFSV